MNEHKNITTAAEQQSGLWAYLDKMETKLLRVKNLVEVLWLAGEGLADMRKRNAITTQCDTIDELLRDALDIRAEVAAAVQGRAA